MGWENFDVFDVFQLDCQDLTHQIVENNTAFTGVWWMTVTNRQNIFRQMFEESGSVKILRYTVSTFLRYTKCPEFWVSGVTRRTYLKFYAQS